MRWKFNVNTASFFNHSILTMGFFFLCNPLFSQDRIISLVPSITQQIYTLDAQDKLVGCTSFCNTEEDNNIPIVASAIDVNIEKVVTLKPDLIFVSSLVKPQTLKTFKELGFKVKNIPTAKNFGELCKYFLLIGDLIEKAEKADKIISELNQRLSDLKTAIPEKKTQKIFMEIGAKPLFSVIPNTFMDDYIKFVGGVNIFHNMKHGTITRESVLVKNPDIIFIVSMGVIGEEETKTWKEYKTLNATKNNKIFTLDANISSVPTPVNYVKTVEEMINLMY